jgi:hypothetical protein
MSTTETPKRWRHSKARLAEIGAELADIDRAIEETFAEHNARRHRSQYMRAEHRHRLDALYLERDRVEMDYRACWVALRRRGVIS